MWRTEANLRAPAWQPGWNDRARAWRVAERLHGAQMRISECLRGAQGRVPERLRVCLRAKAYYAQMLVRKGVVTLRDLHQCDNVRLPSTWTGVYTQKMSWLQRQPVHERPPVWAHMASNAFFHFLWLPGPPPERQAAELWALFEAVQLPGRATDYIRHALWSKLSVGARTEHVYHRPKCVLCDVLETIRHAVAYCKFMGFVADVVQAPQGAVIPQRQCKLPKWIRWASLLLDMQGVIEQKLDEGWEICYTDGLRLETKGVVHAVCRLWYAPDDPCNKQIPIPPGEKQSIGHGELYGVLTAVENKTPGGAAACPDKLRNSVCRVKGKMCKVGAPWVGGIEGASGAQRPVGKALEQLVVAG